MERDKELSIDELEQAAGGAKKQQAELGQNQNPRRKPPGFGSEGEAEVPPWQQ